MEMGLLIGFPKGLRPVGREGGKKSPGFAAETDDSDAKGVSQIEYI